MVEKLIERIFEFLNKLLEMLEKYGKESVLYAILIGMLIANNVERTYSVKTKKEEQQAYLTSLENQRKEDEAARRTDRAIYVNLANEQTEALIFQREKIVELIYKVDSLEKELARRK